MSALEGLWLLAFSSFTSATILPGSSEVALVAFLIHYPDHLQLAFWVATIGNALGAVVMLLMGRMFPQKQVISPKTTHFIQRYGAWSLLFSSVPIVGDLLPIAAGWWRLKIVPCLIAIVIGKAARYLLMIALLDLAQQHVSF